MKPLRPSRQGREFLRFASVALAGLAVDISLAWGLSAVAGFSLILGAATGFVAGATFNYLMHEFWTFPRSERRLSYTRMLRYGAVLVATLATRLAAVYALSQIPQAKQTELVVLLLATVLSFSVNYLASKYVVFKSAVLPETTSKGNGP